MRLQDLTALVRGLAPVLRDHVALLQAKDRGLDGAPGPAGPEGKPGRDGQPGIPGRDGARGDRGTDGEKGQDGAPGRDGTLESLRVEQVDERSWKLVRADGTTVPGGVLTFSVPLYRGVYTSGATYTTGDAVTFGGSVWIARATTTEKPGDGETKWWRAVNRGSQGSQGRDGTPGPKGDKGDRGEPGRNFS